MHMSNHWSKYGRHALSLLGLILILGLLGYGAYSYERVRAENSSLTEQLALSESERSNLINRLTAASSTIDAFTTQLGDITTTVGTLQKRVDTDPQLLEKYSKIFFLSDNYVPKGLTDIGPTYTYSSKSLQFLTAAYPFLTQLIDAANQAGQHLSIESAYRSFGEQSELKSSYRVTYGAGTANSFSADQGYSEHQLGTAVDFTTVGLKGGLSGFDKTSEYTWLNSNAYKYGFVLSYPAGNSYYIYEPWHWRFVGIALATRLHEEHQNFYDLEQRQIDPYIVTLFDPAS